MTEYPEITHHEDGDVVSIWVGLFSDEGEFKKYIEPFYSPGPETDDLPLSSFATDIGLSWYDEDFLEARLLPATECDTGRLVADHSYAESFLAELVRSRPVVQPVNAVFLLYGYDHTRHPQSEATPKRVIFLGTFPYTPAA